MRRILSLPGLAVLAWLASLGLIVLLAGMLAFRAWHPHFLPATVAIGLVVVAGVALVAGCSWRIVRGPDRLPALSWLLIGSAPLWFLAGYFLYGLMIGTGRKIPMSVPLAMLATLGESLMDLEARYRYPMRTAGRKVVMISEPMPEEKARALVDAMDRHVEALEERLGRPTDGIVHWTRGPLLGMGGHAVFGLCMGSRPGEHPPGADGLVWVDRHEVAHCVLTSHCAPWFEPPAVLTEGWAQANQGEDPVEQAERLREALEKGSGMSLRQLVGPDWYDRHEWPVYQHGAPLVHFLLRRFGPDRFIELYRTCNPSTFEDDCRRILGLDLDGLDAAFRDDLERVATRDGPAVRRRLERMPLAPGVDPVAWKSFVDDYLAAADRLLAPYRDVRMTTVWAYSRSDARGRKEGHRIENRVLRSGEFASLRRRSSDGELAYLAHPRHSIVARRDAPGRPWQVQDESRRTPEQSRRHALGLIDDLDLAGRWSTAPLIGLADEMSRFAASDVYRVAAFERSSEDGRPRVRVRIEQRRSDPRRVLTFVLAADNLYAIQSGRSEGVGVENKEVFESRYLHDRHDGIPVLRSLHTAMSAADGARGTIEFRVVDRRFGPIPAEEFDPDRFLDGLRVIEKRPDRGGSTVLQRSYWLPFLIGALGLVCGASIPIGTSAGRRPLGS